MKNKKLSLICIALVFGLNTSLWAADDNPRTTQVSNQDHPHMGSPPQAAIDACMNKKEGELVSFISPRGDKIQASCQTRREGLVAVPEHPHQNGRPANQQKSGQHQTGSATLKTSP